MTLSRTLRSTVRVLAVLTAWTIVAPEAVAQRVPREVARVVPHGGYPARFGSAVAVDQGTVAVGAPEHGDVAPLAGAVFVYEESSASGEWELVQELLPPLPNGISRDFGTKLALEGTTLVVGWPGYRSNRTDSEGAVAVYGRTGPPNAPWVFERALIAQSNDELGSSLAIDGDTIAAGALTVCTCLYCTPTEAVYTFGRDEGGPGAWGLLARIPSPQVSFDRFGTSLALQSGELYVGAPFDGGPTLACVSGVGLVHVAYEGLDWDLGTPVAAPLSAMNVQGFGDRIALDGDLLVAREFSSSTLMRRLHVFGRSAAAPDWKPLRVIEGDRAFAEAVVVEGDSLFASRDLISITGGCVDWYRRQADGGADAFGLVATIKPDVSFPFDVFGGAIATDGRILVVGAPDNESAGAAHIFELPGAQQPKRTKAKRNRIRATR